MRAVAIVATAILAACMPQVVTEPELPQGGPTLVLDVTNRTGESRHVEVAYEAERESGVRGGEFPCGRSQVEFGAVSGSYAIRVDGKEVASGRVPDGLAPAAHVVFRIQIDDDGTDVIGPNIMARVPTVQEPCG